nr:hypothetical protein [Tanacetum cinerariifolium]
MYYLAIRVILMSSNENRGKGPRRRGARAHGEIGEGVLVLFRCLQVYRSSCGEGGVFGREKELGVIVWWMLVYGRRLWGKKVFGGKVGYW